MISAVLYGRRSPITQAWATSALALDGRIDVGRRHVLAPRVDDQLLLAVDDPQIAVLIERADVAGVQPAPWVERRGSLSGLIPIA